MIRGLYDILAFVCGYVRMYIGYSGKEWDPCPFSSTKFYYFKMGAINHKSVKDRENYFRIYNVIVTGSTNKRALEGKWLPPHINARNSGVTSASRTFEVGVRPLHVSETNYL